MVAKAKLRLKASTVTKQSSGFSLVDFHWQESSTLFGEAMRIVGQPIVKDNVATKKLCGRWIHSSATNIPWSLEVLDDLFCSLVRRSKFPSLLAEWSLILNMLSNRGISLHQIFSAIFLRKKEKLSQPVGKTFAFPIKDYFYLLLHHFYLFIFILLFHYLIANHAREIFDKRLFKVVLCQPIVHIYLSKF